MGIKHFFTWFKANFLQHIHGFSKSLPMEVSIDTFMIDLNGVFHNSAQKVYQYGNFSKPKSLLGKKKMSASAELNEKVYQDVCATIEELFSITKPKKRLVLAIDGVAPLSKQNQQRQRRYRGAVEDPENFFNTANFDTCSITPGTKFMDYLSKYIDFFIRKRMTESQDWAKIEVIFSDEKVPGEGEHKLINYIRKYGSDEETFCINALDADLVMLSLATHKSNFYLLREDLYAFNTDYMYVNIGAIRKELLSSVVFWEHSTKTDKQTIQDFVLICFLCGNDFLPNIPSIAIMEKGLDTIIDLYKQTCKTVGHLTDENGKIIKDSFKTFLQLIACSEQALLEEKMLHKIDYISDSILERHYINNTLDFEAYRKDFYDKKNMRDLKEVCTDYLDGCQWILTYYTNGIDNWNWIYKFNYSPFATDLVSCMDSYVPTKIITTEPMLPFQQLLCVLPPKSSNLVPVPLNNLFLKSSKLSEFYPDSFNINYEGKKKKWEGVVELPVVNVDEVKKAYFHLESKIAPVDAKRNIIGESFLYKFSIDDFFSDFRCHYGHLRNCPVTAECIKF